MIAVQAMYQTSDQVNTKRRPNWSDDTAEQDEADPEAGEGGKHEGAEAGDLDGMQSGEEAERLRREQARFHEAGCNVAGEEQVVEIKYAAERDQDDNHPDRARRR